MVIASDVAKLIPLMMIPNCYLSIHVLVKVSGPSTSYLYYLSSQQTLVDKFSHGMKALDKMNGHIPSSSEMLQF